MAVDVGMILRRQAEMEADRATWESHWQEIADRLFTRASDFFGQKAQGAKRTQKVFDSTAVRALPKFASIMESLLVPRNQIWHKLKLTNDEGREGGPAAEYLDSINKKLFQARYSAFSNFASAAHEGFMSLGSFGTMAIFTGSSPDSVLWYRVCHIAEVYFAENAYGRIDTVHRKFAMTARQIVQKFDKARLPSSVLEKAEKRPEDQICVLHCTWPNGERIYGREDAAGMPWRSAYVLPEHNAAVEESGYRSWPWAISRYVKGPRETYGRSPAMDALPDVKTLNAAQMARYGSWHQAIKPSYLVADDGILSRLNMQPGAINVGGVTSEGRPRVLPLQNTARLDIDQTMQQDMVAAVEDPFLIRLFLMAVDNPNMTATEVLERIKQQGILLAPQAGRQQSEFLGPLVDREVEILAYAGQLPVYPEMDGGGVESYQVEYVSPLATAARAEQALAIIRGYQQVSLIAAAQPEVLDNFDPDAAYKEIAWSAGWAASLTRSDDEVEAIRQQRAQQQAMQAALAAAPVAGKTVADLSKAAAA